MANAFSKEEKVAFDDMLEGFEDALVLSKLVRKHASDQTMMARTNDVFWRPQPYIARSFDGPDQTLNFANQTQLSVPSTIGFRKSSPWQMSDTELRDALQEGRLGDAAKQKLASDINRSILDVVSNQGSLFVKRSAAATGFDDVAAVEAILNEQGIPMGDRNLALSTRDYNAMAGELSKASRSFGNEISDKALRAAFVGSLAGIDTYKLDYANRKAAAAGGAGLTINTLVAGANFYTPKATSAATTGEQGNVDNRFQTITISSTTSVAAGDAFTIAGLEACHHITKQSTGSLKTFRVISVASATTLVICPPIVSGQGATPAELQYQNVVGATLASNSAIVFLNTVVGALNPFWCKDSIEILPGRIALPENAGIEVIRGSTDQGIELVMQKAADINTGQIKYRVDVLYGVVNLQPQMTGVIMFSQT